MYDPPGYLWAITIAGIIAIPAVTCVVLYGGAVRAGLSRRRAALLALPAGVGDIAAGIAALLIVLRPARAVGRRTALRFNAFGMADLVVALTLGALTGFQLINVIPSGAPISELPLALIPTAAVPLLFALHITSVSALVRAPRTPLPATAPLTAAAR